LKRKQAPPQAEKKLYTYKMKTEDTIAAISTPMGKGGIGIIRISGEDAFNVAEKVLKGSKRISELESHRAYHGYFINRDSGEVLDEVMYIVMRAPNTYTREDMVEINTHGGVYLIRSLLEIVLSKGARIAEPGEFTFRAFINGRIDLTQAEAVADLIEAESEKVMKIAVRQVVGELKSSIKEIMDGVIDIYSISEAEIDFVEEDIELEDKDMLIKRLNGISDRIIKMIESYKIGRYYKDGIKIGIYGRVNVGKSSLLNALIGKDRVIVSDEPGTTRDIIDGEITHKGVLLKIVDTAGLRESAGYVEKEGVKRTELTMEDSDIAVLVIDISDIQANEDLKIYNDLKNKFFGDKKLFIAYNKIDLVKNINKFKPIIKCKDEVSLLVSAKEKIGIDKLKDEFTEGTISHKSLENNDILIVNIRHQELLKKAHEGIQRLIKGYENNVPNEFLALDFSETIEYLSKITGDAAGEDLLDRIFSKFCIGK